VSVRVLSRSKGFLRATLESVLEPGKGRRPSPCPLFEQCGGCSFLHLDETVQRQSKQGALARALKLPEIVLSSGSRCLEYRRLARLHYDPKVRAVGFVAEQEQGVVETAQCPVLTARLCKTLPLLVPRLLAHVPQPAEVWIGEGEDGAAISIACAQPLPPAFYEAARAAVPESFSTVIAQVAGHTGVVAGDGTLRVIGADGEKMSLPAGGFGQANEEVNLLLGQRVASLLSGLGAKRGLELFSGAGNLTGVLASHIGKLDCVELDLRAVAAAKTNLRERGLVHVGVHGGEAFDGYRRLGKDRDIVILDPPRTGSIEVAQALCAGKPRRVLYISCDPATLARDLGPLRQEGYSIAYAEGFDMFPQTPHLEAVVLLER
jgi:23S rRNA (uracil1939-C5)-methyltransferase